MKKKTVSRLSAMFMAGAMMVATFGMSVCAEDKVTSVPVTKTITADANVQAPNTNFSFTVVPAEADTTLDDDTVVYKGVAGGAYFAGNADTLSFAPGDALSKSTNISLNSSVFTKPGIYRYVVTETAGNYDGMSYSTVSYNLDVYVVLEDTTLKIDGVILNDTPLGTGEGKSAGIVFANTYTTNDLTVTKSVTGNQGDKNKDFSFTVRVTGSNEGEKYTMMVGGESVVLESGKDATFTLKDGQSAVIYGLSANDTYKVEEENYKADGYTTTIGEDETRSSEGKIETDTTVTVVNDKNVTTPTGIIASYAPYILMVVVAGAAVVLFLRRRNRAEF